MLDFCQKSKLIYLGMKAKSKKIVWFLTEIKIYRFFTKIKFDWILINIKIGQFFAIIEIDWLLIEVEINRNRK